MSYYFFLIHFHSIASSNFNQCINHALQHCFFLNKQHKVVSIFHCVNYFTCPPILNSTNPSRTFFVMYLLYKFNRTANKQHPCVTPFLIFTLLASPWSSHILTFWPTYNLLINLLFCQYKPVCFRICINLAQFTWLSALCHFMKQAHTSWSMFKIHSDIILSIPTPSLVPLPLVFSNWPFSNYDVNFLLNPTSTNPRYCHYYKCNKVDCVMVTTFL